MTQHGMIALALVLSASLPLAAQDRGVSQTSQQQVSSSQQDPQQTGAQQPPPTEPAQQKPKPGEAQPPEIPTYEETVVVSASKVEQALINAPATVSVITSQTLQSSPAQNYADLLRAVPGLNVSQISARDINLTSRGATSTLSTSQLALLDGRTIYQDFFGFVAWDFLPVNLSEIKQIEVIRGPASAIWGANALTGVVNVITKSPREMQGTTVTLGVGTFDRTVGSVKQSAGSLFSINGTHAQAVNDRLAFKVSAGVYTQDPLPRPVGTIPNQFNTPYPPFVNQGTTQPKVDGRVDYDFEDGKQKLIFAGGMAGTEGIMHSGIGPFDIQRGTKLGYGKVNYSRGALRANFFINALDGNATNLLTVGVDGKPISFVFKGQTYDFEFGNVQTIGTTHVISYGGNIRHNAFDLSIAPLGNDRNEGGGYIQDEIFLSDHFRWVIGGRLDKFSVLKDPVFSPRTTFMIKPLADQTFRLSVNRAYRAPSLVNNYLDTVVFNEIDLGLINPALAGRGYPFPVVARGNTDLTETSMTAYEIGYTGIFRNRATVTASFYINKTKGDIFFTQVDSYTSRNPPPGWPLPPVVLDLLILGNAFGPRQGLPSNYSYVNLGEVEQKGLELSLDAMVNRDVSAFVNYSFQATPKPTGFDISELNIPSRHLFNAGFNFSHGRYLGNMSVNYTDSAYWQDVLDARYHGPTKAYTLINGGFGIRWRGERLVTSVKVTNLANVDAQQHIFGDVIKRQVVGELRVGF